MKALKIAVVGLAVIVVGLLFTIRRLANQPAQEGAPPPAATQAPVAQVAPPSTPAPAAEPAAPPEPGKPSPGRRLPAAKPRPTSKPAEPAQRLEAPPVEQKPPAVAVPSPSPAVEAPQPPPAPPAPRRVTIPAGTAVIVRTQNTLSTERNFKGDTFSATLEEPLTVDGLVIAEKGAEVEGVVVRSEKAGRVQGVSELVVELVRLHTSDGQKVSIATNVHDVEGERSRRSDAKKIGVATGIGAIIGAIAGGGKGAAIGAGAGAGAGTGAVLAGRGKPSVIPSETTLTFHLRTPVEVTERR